jgi:hypothetical protein
MRRTYIKLAKQLTKPLLAAHTEMIATIMSRPLNSGSSLTTVPFPPLLSNALENTFPQNESYMRPPIIVSPA